MTLPTEQIIALAGVIAGYVGRMFTKEASLECRIVQLEKDVTAAHTKLREAENAPDKT